MKDAGRSSKVAALNAVEIRAPTRLHPGQGVPAARQYSVTMS
jgi:hypothetical protein